MTYLAIQNSYDEVQIALCTPDGIKDRVSINKMHASAQCIPALDTLLAQHNLTSTDIDYIVANCGPGPFTTLRVVLTTVNGIHAASAIPLIGINALKALLEEYQHPEYPLTLALLNAFNQDVYYAYIDPATNIYTQGCQNVTTLIKYFAQLYPEQPIQCIGNGALLHNALITNIFGAYAHIPTPVPETCSLEQIQRMGLKEWQQKKWQTTPLIPEYLKSAAPLIKTSAL